MQQKLIYTSRCFDKLSRQLNKNFIKIKNIQFKLYKIHYNFKLKSLNQFYFVISTDLQLNRLKRKGTEIFIFIVFKRVLLGIKVLGRNLKGHLASICCYCHTNVQQCDLKLNQLRNTIRLNTKLN